MSIDTPKPPTTPSVEDLNKIQTLPSAPNTIKGIESKKGKGKWYAIGAGALIVAGAIGGGIGLANQPSNPGPVAEAPADPSEAPVETEAPVEVLPTDPNRTSPAEIAAMSPEEITAFATITQAEATTPEEYAEKFVYIYDAWVNAGATDAEFAPYLTSGKGVYENAMVEKYDHLFNAGIAQTGTNTNGISDTHYEVLNNHMTDLTFNDKVKYDYVSTLANVTVLEQSDSGGFLIDIEIDTADNQVESGVSEYTHQDNIDSRFTAHLRVARTSEGTFKVIGTE